jgi:hypothetical protein
MDKKNRNSVAKAICYLYHQLEQSALLISKQTAEIHHRVNT